MSGTALSGAGPTVAGGADAASTTSARRRTTAPAARADDPAAERALPSGGRSDAAALARARHRARKDRALAVLGRVEEGAGGGGAGRDARVAAKVRAQGRATRRPRLARSRVKKQGGRASRHGCDVARASPLRARITHCVSVVLQPRCGVVQCQVFFFFVSWYLLAFRGSPSLSPFSSLRGIVGTVRYVLDLWIIW